MNFEVSLIITVLFTQTIVDRHDNGPFQLSQIAPTATIDLLFTPNDPGAEDDSLRRYYSASSSGGDDENEIVEYLLTLPTVEAAWVQPAEGPPL
jgi:hypothetical protein